MTKVDIGEYNTLVNKYNELYKENKKLKEELEKIKTSQKKESKKKYGEYQNVKLTDKEFDSIVKTYGLEVSNDLIRYLDEYIEMKGYKAKSHYLCIKKWVVDAVKQNKYKNKNVYNKPANPVPDWFDKEVKSTPAKPEEVERIKELLKDYQ